MALDECLLVDAQDNVSGSASKYDAHRLGALDNVPGAFTLDGFALHRAFSVFLFDSKGRLLLQQRAGTKITFPLVWTNTCCSHPLSGQQPDEIDSPEEVADGTTIGVKRAAVRKLQQELGIEPSQLPLDSFKFLTRLHYCAADDTDPEPGCWGEHEIDYILFAQVDVDLKPNPEEVDSVKYVELEELQAMMDPSSGLRWSPWFRIIASRFLPNWWSDLHTTIHTDKFRDGVIHRFDN
jgi:isopentenyl-diphosphate delta-isomerase